MKDETLYWLLGLGIAALALYEWNQNQPAAGAVTPAAPGTTVDNQNNGTGLGAYSLPDGSTGGLDPTTGTFG